MKRLPVALMALVLLMVAYLPAAAAGPEVIRSFPVDLCGT